MKISRFKTNVLADSITPQISFCVNISTDELRLFNVDDFFSLEERERAFGKMMLEEISNARIKEINIPMAINLDGSIRSKNERLINKFEKIADNIFILSLIFIFLITLMVFFTVVL